MARLRSFLSQNPLLQEFHIEIVWQITPDHILLVGLPHEMVNLKKFSIEVNMKKMEINVNVLRVLKESCPSLMKIEIIDGGNILVADNIFNDSSIQIGKFSWKKYRTIFWTSPFTSSDDDLKCVNWEDPCRYYHHDDDDDENNDEF